MSGSPASVHFICIKCSKVTFDARLFGRALHIFEKQWSTKIKVSAAKHGILIQRKATFWIVSVFILQWETRKCVHAWIDEYITFNKRMQNQRNTWESGTDLGSFFFNSFFTSDKRKNHNTLKHRQAYVKRSIWNVSLSHKHTVDGSGPSPHLVWGGIKKGIYSWKAEPTLLRSAVMYHTQFLKHTWIQAEWHQTTSPIPSFWLFPQFQSRWEHFRSRV